MPQKSFEQYERELMEMYRLALAKDPNYAALAKRQSQAMVQDRIPQKEKIDVEIPAPVVEESVPLPDGIAPVAEAPEMPEASTTPMMPNMPRTPAMPEASTTPMMPTMPRTPAMPEASTTPMMPTMPRTPAMPETSTTPMMPTMPRTPAMPEASTTPMMPNMPRTPAMPEASTTPMMPTMPRTPAMPETSTTPKLPSSVFREPFVPGVATLQQESFESPALAVVLPVPDTISRTDVEPQTRTQTRTQTLFDSEAGSTNQTRTQIGAGFVPTAPPDQQATAAKQAPSGTQTAPMMPAPDGMRRAMGTPNMGAGNLIVNVTTQNRTKPVMGAVVTVSHPEESGNKVVAKVTTDNSGKTEPIRLPAPIREIPVYPQPMIGGDLSAQYFVSVEAPGFKSANDEEISIFDGVTSVKRIDLVSATDSEDSTADGRSDDIQRE